MRFVAGGGAAAKLLTGAVAELLLAWALRRSCRPAWAQRRRAIGKMLLTGAAAERLTGRYAVAKLLAGAPWRRGRQGTPEMQKSQLRQTELALLKPLVVSKRNNL